MNRKPIGPKLHGAIDYGFFSIQTLAPGLFGLKGTARTLSYAFGVSQGILNLFTNQPLALKKIVPFRVHGQLETPFVPALILLPWLTGALKQRNARRYFISFFSIALANYLLTDYKANEKEASRKKS